MTMPQKYTLILDDPAMYLDERGNPRQGRRLVFQGPDDVKYEITVTATEYRDAEAVKARLKELTGAHTALGEVSL